MKGTRNLDGWRVFSLMTMLTRGALLTALVLTAALPAVAAGSAPATIAAQQPIPTPQPPSATVSVCHQAPDIADRYATFAAQMSATVPGTTQMSIRLELDERTPLVPILTAVPNVPGFDVWKTSTAGVTIFSVSQEVTSLTAPASFRVTAAFRWLGPHKRVLKRATRTSPACAMPVVPAGLVVGTLGH